MELQKSVRSLYRHQNPGLADCTIDALIEIDLRDHLGQLAIEGDEENEEPITADLLAEVDAWVAGLRRALREADIEDRLIQKHGPVLLTMTDAELQQERSLVIDELEAEEQAERDAIIRAMMTPSKRARRAQRMSDPLNLENLQVAALVEKTLQTD